METSLHRQLKEHYCQQGCQIEVPLGQYRIDVVRGEELIEIQHGSLSSIRDKVQRLLAKHTVRVVKPIVARKRIFRRQRRGGRVVSQRLSPKRGTMLDLFDELIYFTRVFPHRNLILEIPLVEIEEWRYPGHGRRRYRRDRDHEVEDQLLTDIIDTQTFRSACDLLRLVPKLPTPFDTQNLADGLDVARWQAQKIAYCLKHVGSIQQIGKRGNAFQYQLANC
ncbi:MAG: hypothetical protein R3E01_08215 [Pirellulaceae bacterium]|nr:hypothetical protein [Planctomycetales bacterium]